MIDPNNVPDVSEDEVLARFLLFSRWIRQDGTVKPDAFIPHPYPDLSVTRHRETNEEVLWNNGVTVAAARKLNLYGRADVKVIDCHSQSLLVAAAPLPDNPNHANIINWPADKPHQKMIAVELSKASGRYKPNPRL